MKFLYKARDSPEEKTQKIFIHVNQEQQNKSMGKQSLLEKQKNIFPIKKMATNNRFKILASISLVKEHENDYNKHP